MLRLEGVSKAFAGVAALQDVSLRVARGSIHGLLGENGAGKTTLMRILLGLERPDQGRLLIEDRPLPLGVPRAARRAGVGMVHQHFALVRTLPWVENLVLSTGAGLGPVSRPRVRAQAAAVAERLGWRLPPLVPVGELAVGEQQRLEIIAALMAGGRLLVLDEPTAPLTPQEADDLFRALRALAQAGTGIIFITHKLAEVEAVCDRLTILRRGRVVHEGAVEGLTRARMAELVVGTALPAIARRASTPPGEVRLSCAGLCTQPAPGHVAVTEASFAVRAGEIVGVAGVDGNGQAELVQALLGLRASTGTIRVLDRRIPGRELRRRIGIIPDDRRHDGLALERSVRDNLLLRAGRTARLSPGGWIRRGRWRILAQSMILAADIRLRDAAQVVAALSGGNQQKVVVARELGEEPALVIAANPTRGLDPGAATSVLTALLAARDRGAAVLLVHADLDELLAVSDRVLVIARGRVRESTWPACSRAEIGALMLASEAAAAGTADA